MSAPAQVSNSVRLFDAFINSTFVPMTMELLRQRGIQHNISHQDFVNHYQTASAPAQSVQSSLPMMQSSLPTQMPFQNRNLNLPTNSLPGMSMPSQGAHVPGMCKGSYASGDKRGQQCDKRAAASSEYCGTHDPAKKAARGTKGKTTKGNTQLPFPNMGGGGFNPMMPGFNPMMPGFNPMQQQQGLPQMQQQNGLPQMQQQNGLPNPMQQVAQSQQAQPPISIDASRKVIKGQEYLVDKNNGFVFRQAADPSNPQAPQTYVCGVFNANTDDIDRQIKQEDFEKFKVIGAKKDDALTLIPSVSSLPNGLPSHLPGSLPHGLPSQLPNGLPSQLPNGLPSQLPNGLPSQLPNGLSQLPNSLPQQNYMAQPQQNFASLPSSLASMSGSLASSTDGDGGEDDEDDEDEN
jgi:hypothetical protein